MVGCGTVGRCNEGKYNTETIDFSLNLVDNLPCGRVVSDLDVVKSHYFSLHLLGCPLFVTMV